MRKTKTVLFVFILMLVTIQASNVQSSYAIPRFMLMNYGTCKNINPATAEPIDLTDEFSRNDSLVYAWFMIGYTQPTNATYTWKWYDPTEKLQQETSLNHSGSGPWSIYGEPLQIQKIPMQQRIGVWRVEVYIDGTLLFQQNFTIGKYIVTLGVKGLPKGVKTAVTVDGNRTEQIESATGLTLQFDEGTIHTFEFERIVNGGEGKRYVNSTSAGPFKISGKKAVKTSYLTQYYLQVDSQYGSPQGSGWYDVGANANFSVTSPVYDYVAAKHVFTGWTGDYVGTESSGMIQMDGPRMVEALWESDYTLTYVLVVVILAVVVALLVMRIRIKRRGGPKAT